MAMTGDVARIINEFENRKEGDKGFAVAFPNLDRKEVADGLRERVQTPGAIHQGESSLCGPAALLFNLANSKPKVYAEYVIDLYEKGEASIGSILVKPGHDCKNFDPSKDSGIIPAVDWIALASLRDSENDFFDYDDVGDQVAGITMPSDFAQWHSKAGFTTVTNDTNLVFDNSLFTLLKAHHLYKSGGKVSLFVGANVLKGETGRRAPADHWVVLTSLIKIDGKNADSLYYKGESVNDDKTLLSKKIEFMVFTWGNRHYPVNRKTPGLTVAHFLDYFYGYVCCY